MTVDSATVTSLLSPLAGAGAGLLDFGGGATSAASGFGPDTLVSLTPGGVVDAAASAVLGAAYQPATAPQNRLSDKQRADFQKRLANAMAQHAVGETQAAKVALDGLLKESPTYAFAYQALGQIALDEQDYRAAEQLFRKADYFGPQYGFAADAENARVLGGGDDAALARARVLVAGASTREDGIRLLVGFTERSPDNAKARILLADALIEHRDVINGLSQYREALASADKSELAQIRSRIEALVEQAPQSAAIKNLLGQTLLKQGKAREGLALLEESTRLSKDDPIYRLAEAPGYVAVGRAALEAGNIEAALSAFTAARDRDPVGEETSVAYAEGLGARAAQRLRLGNSGRAAADFAGAARVLRTFGDDVLRNRIADGAYRAALRMESARLAAGGRVGDEVVAFQAAYDLNSENAAYKRKLADTRATLGDEFLADGKFKDAAYSYKRAVDLFSDDAEYKSKAINAFRQHAAERLARFLDYDGAIDGYLEAHRIDRNDVAARDDLAATYNARGLNHLSEGRISAALADFREAVRLNPENSDYAGNLASLS